MIWKIQGTEFWTAEENKKAQKRGLLDRIQTKLYDNVDVEENEIRESESSLESRIRGNSWEYGA